MYSLNNRDIRRIEDELNAKCDPYSCIQTKITVFTDGFGNKFYSLADMLRFHNMPHRRFERLRSLGFTLKEMVMISDETIDKIIAVCKKYNVRTPKVLRNIRSGMTITDAIKKERRISDEEFIGRFKNDTDLCKAYNVSYATFRYRIEHGMTKLEAVTVSRKPREKKGWYI